MNKLPKGKTFSRGHLTLLKTLFVRPLIDQPSARNLGQKKRVGREGPLSPPESMASSSGKGVEKDEELSVLDKKLIM